MQVDREVIDVVSNWFLDNCPVTDTGIPQEVKAYYIKRIADDHGLKILVETGTGFGDMTTRVVNDFDRIYSVELHPDFSTYSINKFKDYPHVKISQGESGDFVAKLLFDLRQSALWFLDAHYAGPGSAMGSEKTPVLTELKAILDDQRRHVVIIDDARLFGVDEGYPDLDTIFKMAEQYGYEASIWGDEIVVQ